MKTKKLRRILAEDRAERSLNESITWDTLVVHFPSRTLKFRGRTITVANDVVSIPILGTDRAILVRDGSEVA